MGSLDDRPVFRPARALIGWMTPDEAQLTLASRREEDKDRPEFELRARRARLVASARRPVVDARNTVTEAPASLRRHTAVFERGPRAARLLAEGWRIALVDLRQVCAVQPMIFTDAGAPEVEPDDLAAIADVTLQLPTELAIDAQYDRHLRAWVIAAPSPNFRIVGEYSTQLEAGVLAFGFKVQLLGSFLQVVRYRDRYLIRDGNHRALAFLERGISVVPALVREFSTLEEIQLRRGMLPVDVFLGDSPPLLSDYLDNEVSARVELPAIRRVLMIQGVDIPVSA